MNTSECNSSDIQTLGSDENAVIMLADNGSSKVNAQVKLRHLAKQLGDKTGQKIHAISVKHSHLINKEDVNKKLDGIKAQVFNEFMADSLQEGKRHFIFIPLFFGNSSAITSFIPEQVERLKETYGFFVFKIARTLYPINSLEPSNSKTTGEPRVVNILYNHLLTVIQNKRDNDNQHESIVLVDHGSPKTEVTAVRNHISVQLNKRLKQTKNNIMVEQAVMERRSAVKFDFNGELLKDYLMEKALAGEKRVIILLLFLLPGTHAGEGGDIANICQAVVEKYPDFSVSISPLVSENIELIDCLEERLNEVMVT